MTWVMAMTREPTPDDDRRWQIATFDKKPDAKIGEPFTDEDGVTWTVKDVFL